MKEKLYPHPGNLPVFEALDIINKGELEDLPVPEGLTRTQVERGLQMDQWMGRGSRVAVIEDMADCCAIDCSNNRHDTNLSPEELSQIEASCPGKVFAGIGANGELGLIFRTGCPASIPESSLPIGRRVVGGRYFMPQQVPDQKVEKLVEALTPKTTEDVEGMIKIVLKNFMPMKPRATYHHSESYTSKSEWSEKQGARLQSDIYDADTEAKKLLGDDYSVNRSISLIAESFLDRLTNPESTYTARKMAIGLGHLATTFARTSKTPTEV